MSSIRIILLVYMLSLGGCVTSDITPYWYSLKIQRIHNVYLDHDDNILVCVDGETKGTAGLESPMTIILPQSPAGLAQLVESAFYYPNSNYKFPEEEIRGYKFSPKWLRRGCLPDDEKKKLRPISVDANLVPKLQVYRPVWSDKEKIQMGREATIWLEQMKSVDGSGRLYQISSTNSDNYTTLVYVADTPRFNGTHKAAFPLVWEEYVPVRDHLNPLVLVGAVVVGLPWAITNTVGQKLPNPYAKKQLTEKEKKEIAKKAAKEFGCTGKITYLPDEPYKWGDASERAYLVRCDQEKAEVKVHCQYYEAGEKQCFVKLEKYN